MRSKYMGYSRTDRCRPIVFELVKRQHPREVKNVRSLVKSYKNTSHGWAERTYTKPELIYLCRLYHHKHR
ncbi:hypothetical protein PM082_018591 [Marasmius tenuissimus]|nr:hypothetical protein PM082_018591 [Marasmius tenuissimus]